MSQPRGTPGVHDGDTTNNEVRCLPASRRTLELCGMGNKVVGVGIMGHRGPERHFSLHRCALVCSHSTPQPSESQGDGQVDTAMERTTSYRHAVDDPPRDEAEEEEEDDEEEEDGGAEPTRVRSQRKSMLPREWLCMIVVACMIVQGALVSWPPKLGSFQQQQQQSVRW
jgi:hypothetical protein